MLERCICIWVSFKLKALGWLFVMFLCFGFCLRLFALRLIFGLCLRLYALLCLFLVSACDCMLWFACMSRNGNGTINSDQSRAEQRQSNFSA
eukprot:Gb_24621 [translate_table: standard]